MKKLSLLFLMGFVYNLYAQSTDEIIQQIREDYAHINNDLLPESAKIKLVHTGGDADLVVAEDEILNPSISEYDRNIRGFWKYELYFHRYDSLEKWKLIKVTCRYGFGDAGWVSHEEMDYYIMDQERIFSYVVKTDEYDKYNDSLRGSSKFYETERKEERFYYSNGKLIRHLQKEKNISLEEAFAESAPLLEELMLSLPSKQMPIIESDNAEKFKAWINEMIKDWEDEVELLE